MLLLFIMTLAGSIPLLCYLLLFYVIGDKLPMKLYMLLLRMSIIFYLCPFQVFKYLLPAKLLNLSNNLEISYQKSVDVINYIDMQKISGNYLIYPSYIPIIYIICLVCFAVRAFITWYKYFKSQRELLLTSDVLDDNLHEFIDKHPQFARLSRKSFFVFRQEHANTPFTVGFFSPCIVLPDWGFNQTQKEYIYSHELTHILHHDVPWKALCTMAVLLHWYNPLAHLLMSQHSNACEYYADEYCTSCMSKNEQKDYITFIVRLTRIISGKKYIIPSFSNSFIGGKESMKKRIDFIFKERKRSRVRQILSVICVCLVFMMSSMTVFAYSPTVEDSVPLEKIDAEESIEITWSTDDTYSSLAEPDLDFSKYSSYFIDEDGNIVPLTLGSNLEPYTLCNHVYKDGTRQVHSVYADGHCQIKYYEAQICYKCGKCITGSLFNISTWVKCPH